MINSTFATKLDRWRASENMGYFYSLSEIEAVTLPVRVNVVFLGFDADGNNYFKLDKTEMVEWFHHIEHYVRHVTVPVGEDQTTTDKYVTPKTHIKYNFEIEVIKLSPLVNTLIEDTILWNLRPEIPYESTQAKHQKENPSLSGHNGETYYVESYKVSSILAHLVDYLQLNAYTLFVMNPKKTASEHIYGYRTGFSEGELERIEKLNVLQNLTIRVPMYGPPDDNIWKRASTPVRKERISDRLTLSDLVTESENWARELIKEQYNEKKKDEKKEKECRNGEEDDPTCLFLKRRPEENFQPIELHVEEMLNDELTYEMKYLKNIQTKKVHAECLVENWVSHRRFAFIDLSAGPFSWGPIVSGEGVKTKTTLPLVPPHFLYEEFKKAFEAKNEPFDTVPSSLDRDFLRTFYSRYCQNEIQNHPKCQEIGERVKSLAYTDEKMTIKQISDLVYTHDDEKSSPDDSFFSHLGSVLSSSLKHLITPPTPLFSSSYYPRLIFEFYVIANHQSYDPLTEFNYEEFKREINKFKLPDQEFIFNLKSFSMVDDQALSVGFSSSLKTVILPKLNVNGEFSTFPQTYLSSKEMRRQLKLQGVLQDDLKRADDATHSPDDDDLDHGNEIHSKQIPIFLFSLDSREPLFIDKYYQSKALADMVIIIQTDVVEYPSKVACNSKPIYWNLRSPLKAALASTVVTFGGLVPTHITYNEAREAADQNWLWSVSDTPLSYTNSGHKFSLLNVDIVQRNYIVHSLERSIQRVNSAIHLLTSIKINSFERDPDLALLPASNLTHLYGQIQKGWRNIAIGLRVLDFNNAIRQLPVLSQKTKEFYKSCQEVASVLSLIRCLDEDTEPITDKMDWIFPIALCVDVLLLIVISYLLKTRKQKTKLN